MSMVGFESRLARVDPTEEISPTASTTVLLTSLIGAPTFVAGRFQSNGTSKFEPSFLGHYTAPDTHDTFWNIVGNNVGLGSPDSTFSKLTSPPYVYSPSWYNSPSKDKEMNIIVVLKEILEYHDKNNNGIYDEEHDGTALQIVSLECLKWSLPTSTLSFNKTVPFSGETSAWKTKSKSFTKTPNTNYAEKCQKAKMPKKIPEGMISLSMETSNYPVILSTSENEEVYDTTPTDSLMVTQNGMKITFHLKDFPYQNIINGSNPQNIKSRIAFRFYITCDDYNSDFALFENRRLANRQKPSNLDNGYFEWQSKARVKFPGSAQMYSGKYKEQPMKPSRRMKKDANLPGESAKDGFIPHVSDITAIPYSALTEKLRHAYENAWVEDLVLSVGGQALNPSEIIFEMSVNYGSQPIFKTWAGQPGIVLGTLLLLVVVCWCGYGGWDRGRDLQTGYSHADSTEEALARTTRELHEIHVKNTEKETSSASSRSDPAYENLLKKAKGVMAHDDLMNKNEEMGVHFVCRWPCSCEVFKSH